MAHEIPAPPNHREKSERTRRLMPDGTPKYVRCYDNGGDSIDRYTVVFTGRYPKNQGEIMYLAMNAAPFHPQGFGQHGFNNSPIDVNKWGWPPAIGRKNHLGQRIRFADLPADCRNLVIRDYCELWDIYPPAPPPIVDWSLPVRIVCKNTLQNAK